MNKHGLIEIIFNQKGLCVVAHKKNELSCINQDNEKLNISSSFLKEVLFDKLGLYIYSGLEMGSLGGNVWTCWINNAQTHHSNEIDAILECVLLTLSDNKMKTRSSS